MIDKTPITVDEWRKQREIHRLQDVDDPLALGFAAFFLNRTNRSGVIERAGVIGGLNQTGPYKIDCRFNRDDLVRRVRRVAKYRNRIHLTRRDAAAFLVDGNRQLPRSTFLCIDPPYFRKGPHLYSSSYEPKDHEFLAARVLTIEKAWVITYDNHSAISRLYQTRSQFEFDINYSLETKRLGTELLIVSDNLRVPDEVRERQVNHPRGRAA